MFKLESKADIKNCSKVLFENKKLKQELHDNRTYLEKYRTKIDELLATQSPMKLDKEVEQKPTHVEDKTKEVKRSVPSITEVKSISDRERVTFWDKKRVTFGSLLYSKLHNRELINLDI